ncbi:hypothetical protein [Bradyrhizobium uaiense]|uniref:hypothetical protein n=1 Tax=Bradyrhizobium uaiense TaxID=2594946 RepID=UPI0013D416CC
MAAVRQVRQDSGGRYGSPWVYAALRVQRRGASRGRIERPMHRRGVLGGIGRGKMFAAVVGNDGSLLRENPIDERLAGRLADRAALGSYRI